VSVPRALRLAAPAQPHANAAPPDHHERLQASLELGVLGFIRWTRAAGGPGLCPGAALLLGLVGGQPLSLCMLLRRVVREERHDLHRAVRLAVAGGQPRVALECTLQTGSGSSAARHPVRAAARLRYSADGRLESGVVALLDAREQHAVQAALADSQKRLQEAHDVAKLGYWEYDFRTGKVTASPGTLKQLSFDDGKPPTFDRLIEMIPPHQREWVVGLYRTAIAERQPMVRYEIQYNGTDFHMHTIARIEFGAGGKPRRILATVQDVSELKAYRQQVQSLSYFDPLTELPNRALFTQRLRERAAGHVRTEHQLGLLMLGIDRFKDINESLGHAAGDALLKLVAERLHQVLRGYDTVSRLGGDEFAVMLPEVRQPSDLASIASKVLNAFGGAFTLSGREVFVSASLGGALYPQDAPDVEQLMQHADAALHHAKARGRNNFQLYARELTAQAAARLQLETELRHAVERRELELHYQPKYDMASGTLVGAEALMRWNHPHRGLVPPVSFIPLAEETGLIGPMGDWAVQQACAAAVAWNTPERIAAGRPLKIAVNLSPRQLKQGDFVGVLKQALAATGCRPAWLELEITESLLLDGRDGMREQLRSIATLGVSIAIDDFGTGYSALSYLTRFPVHVLKIDRSFIKGLPSEAGSAELVKAIVSLAHGLNMSLVAEGVETEAQAGHLRVLGCQQAQGYLYSKPLPQADFSRLVAAAG
jgi:diguanylate cyclase (GGDEF)-like protein